MKGKYRVGVGLKQRVCFQKTFILNLKYTAFPRKVVGKSARDNPKSIVGRLEFTVVQRNLKEWQERPWAYVFECLRKATKVGSTATVSGTVY